MGFDVLILGAGSAGSVLAARLSENPALRVGLVEAGAMPDDPDIAVPQKWPALQGRAFDWAYATLPQPGTAGRIHPWPRGRVVGGSSCLHAMAHVRGHPDDFEAWAAATGTRRWSYDGLLPAFRRSESFSSGANAPPGGAGPLHGGEGPLPVYLPDAELSPVVRAYMEAGLALGVPHLGDHNGRNLKGVAANSLTIRDGRRVSAADAWLVPALDRPNLTLITGATVERLELEGSRVTGATLVRDGRTEPVFADTVLICAGAVASPLLLMRSGIGAPAVLAKAGVACRLASPDVGENLHDHLLAAGNLYRARRPVPPSRLQHSESLMYLDAADPTRGDGAPDVVLACVAAPAVSECFSAPPPGEAYTVLCGVTHPTSRGRLAITGPDAADPPLIDPAYLTTEHDRRSFVRALQRAREIGHHAALAPWRAEELLPGPAAVTEAELAAFIARAAITHHHPVGTCRMGADPGAVVDADLRLNGLDNAYVVDASVVPAITSGPVHAAVLAIAETFAADFTA